MVVQTSSSVKLGGLVSVVEPAPVVPFFLLIKFEISTVSSVGEMVFSLMKVFSSLALASILSSTLVSFETSSFLLFRFFSFTNMPGDKR